MENKDEQNIIAQERRNRDALINNMPDLLWSVDHDYKLIDANRAFYKAVAYLSGNAPAPGKSVMYEGLSEASVKQWAALYDRALKGETFTEQIFITEHNSGWAEVTLSPIYDGDSIMGAACYSKDVNERRRAEERIRQSEQNMAHAQRLAHIGSWDIELVDGNPFVKTPVWSDETYNILGFDKNNTTPSLELLINLIHPDDKDYVIGAISNGIATNNNTPVSYRIIRPDGTLRWIESEGEIQHDEEGKPTRILGTHQDITEAKLFEKEREKMTADLIQRNKELEQFAYIVSHNLRGPVSNIIGLSNELELDAPADDINHIFLTELKNSVAKLDSVIKDLGYILQRKREITEQKEPVNFAELVNDIKGSISHMITENNAVIETNFSEVPELNTLKSYLYSIFYNLISNSIKYRRADVEPRIIITSKANSEGYVKLTFTDNGIGIDMDKYGEKVFGLYRRFHSHTEGKGMGLYMTKSQIESLGGTIEISSQINMGTQFIIRFKM